jgi:hypothetical protein
MKTLRFSHRAVAFLDILGFKDLVREAHVKRPALERLSRLMHKIQSNAPLNRGVNPGVPLPLHPKATEISDSIVLSTPLRHRQDPNYWGLPIMVMRCSQIASILLEEGYLLTGAINIGPIRHTQRNIIGEAYQDAYSKQSTLSSPAIVLCRAAAAQWEASDYRVGLSSLCLRRSVKFKGKAADGRPTIEEHDVEIVNIFEADYMNSVRVIDNPGPIPPMDDAWLSGCITRIEGTINQNMARFASGAPEHNPSILAKWEWFAQLFHDGGKPGIQQHYSVHPNLIL